MAQLTPRQRQFLKGKAHGSKVIINIGKEGVTDGLVASLSKALDDHELVKVGLLETAELDRKETAELLAEKLDAEVVQVIGFKFVLYRKNKKNPKIVIPTVPEKKKVPVK